MKNAYLTVKKGTSRMFHFFLAVGLSATIFSSCSKDQNIGGQGTGPTTVTITIGGVSDAEVTKNVKASLGGSSTKFTETGETIVNSKKVKVGEFDMDIISAEGTDISFGAGSPASREIATRASNGGKRAADIPMNNGVKYWLIMYNKTTHQYEHSIQGVSGTELKLDVIKNENYDWWAYSYDSEDNIPAFNVSNPQIPTKPDKPLLYAKGTFKATNVGDNRLPILFKHQLQQLRAEVSTRGLFGDITVMTAAFAQNDYVKTGTFDIFGGALTGNLTTVPVTTLNFTNVDPGSTRFKAVRYYTADLSLKSYQVDFTNIQIRLINGQDIDMTPKMQDGGHVTFSFNAPGAGKILLGSLDMWTLFPEKKILHFGPDIAWGYGADGNKAADNFLKNPVNFGPSSRYMRVQNLVHEYLGVSANLMANRLANPANYPDVVICAMFGGFNANDYNALLTYINRGGVVFFMTETKTDYVVDFMKKLLEPNNVAGSKIELGNWGGIASVYEMTNSADVDVLNWPFGDIRGLNWGQDNERTLCIDNIPAGVVEVYSRNSRNRGISAVDNGAWNDNDNPDLNTVSMFRHKTKNVFYVGDTGFLCNSHTRGSATSVTIEPFATNNNDFPVTRGGYGNATTSGAIDYYKPAASWQVSNSIVFGNVFALLVAQSHYMGVDKTP